MRSLAAALVALTLAVAPQAQSGRELAGPVVVLPLGDMADAYRPGIGARVARAFGEGSFGWRIGAEGALFLARPRDRNQRDDGLSLGVTVSGIGRAGDGYALVGVGAFHERAGGRTPYPVVPEAHVGLGLAVPAGRAAIVVEARVQVVVSDLLSGGGFTPSARVPVTVGVRF